MAQEPSRLGLSLRDFLSALKERERNEEAEHYRDAFFGIYCPLLSEEQVLDMSIDDLCEATSLLQNMSSIFDAEARVPTQSLGQTNVCFSDTLGKWYVDKLRWKSPE